MAVLTARLERRRLLAVAMGGFALANLLAALAPGYVGLLAAPLLLALSAATFMPAASGYAASLGGPEQRGRALSTVTTGLTLAIIAGVPLGVLVGQDFGWRAPSSAWRRWRRFHCWGCSLACRVNRPESRPV
jgi:predicted MFS family arabinose efflux permease